MNHFIPVNTPLLSGNEKKYLSECIETSWISSEGPFVRAFEQKFAANIGRKHAIAVANGTAAVDVAVKALGIGAGDEVILPTFTIISCIHEIYRSGATPVFVDCLADTWNMDVTSVEGKITPRTKAIMVVHLYGLPVDMDPILALAKKYGLKIIEDAAQAHGLMYKGKQCGTFGDVSTFSFYPNKHITTGEGGMVVTNDDELAARSESLRNLCFQPEKRFVHEELGWNYRMSNIQAALGVAQLEVFDAHIERKHEIGEKYQKHFCGLPGFQLPVSTTDYALNVYWIFGMIVEEHQPFDANDVIELLRKKGIGTRPFFYPLHQQPVFLKEGLFRHCSYPVAERISRKGFYIPSGLGISNEDIDYVAKSVWDVARTLIKG